MDNAVSLSSFFLGLLAQSLGRGLGSRVSKQREGSTLIFQNCYTRRGPTFGVRGGGGWGLSKTPPIFEHYQQHFIGFWLLNLS